MHTVDGKLVKNISTGKLGRIRAVAFWPEGNTFRLLVDLVKDTPRVFDTWLAREVEILE